MNFGSNKIILNLILFLITVLSTFFVGLTWSLSFLYADLLSENPDAALEFNLFHDSQVFVLSLVYSITLLGILSGHELGHFLACRHYRINATLPFFIPAPTLVGTLGAFIKIKSPITKKHQLFDIGVAGPLTGFILSVPALIYGLSISKVVPPIPKEGSLIFGEPLLLKIIGNLLFRDIPRDFDVILHPVAFAGWVGIFVTALNLFPIGQLDGGHVAYALLGSRARNLARIFFGIYIILGIFFWIGWFLWALIILILGLKHPRVIDEEMPLSPQRKFIGFVMLLIFILTFIPDPIKGYSSSSLWEGLKNWIF